VKSVKIHLEDGEMKSRRPRVSATNCDALYAFTDCEVTIAEGGLSSSKTTAGRDDVNGGAEENTGPARGHAEA